MLVQSSPDRGFNPAAATRRKTIARFLDVDELTLKNGYRASYRKYSRKHLHRYVQEFAGRHNIRLMDTIDQMKFIVRGMLGKLLPYKDLIR